MKKLLLLVCAIFFTNCVEDRVANAQNSASPVVALSFQEFFEPQISELKPSAKLLSLNGQRVRLAGFMAKLENPLAGAFYLCSRPVYADESGGGTGDLPVNAVRVDVRALRDKLIQHVGHAFAVEGILEIGAREESDGTISKIRLIVDAPLATHKSNVQAGAKAKPANDPKLKTTRRK